MTPIRRVPWIVVCIVALWVAVVAWWAVLLFVLLPWMERIESRTPFRRPNYQAPAAPER